MSIDICICMNLLVLGCAILMSLCVWDRIRLLAKTTSFVSKFQPFCMKHSKVLWVLSNQGFTKSIILIKWERNYSISLFRGEISACAAVHTRYVMDTCDCVRPIILLPPVMGTSFVLVALTRLIVSKPKHWVTWSHRTCVNFPFLREERIQYLSVSA